MKKLKTGKLMLIALTGLMGMTACNKAADEPKPDDEKPDEHQVTRLTSISFKDAAVTVEEEGSLDLIIQYNPENVSSSQKGIKYTSSDPETVIVDENFGSISGVKAGNATITATSLVNPSITATCTVTVTAKDRSVAVERIVLDKEEATIAVGRYTYVNAKVLGANNAYATDARLTWSTDHPEIAVIDSATRKISGRAAGHATITAESVANPSITASIEVTVTDSFVAVANVSVAPKTAEIQVTNRPLATLVATVTGENNLTPTDSRVTWSVISGQDKVDVVATTMTNAQVRAKAAGVAVVRATSNSDDTKYDDVTVTVLPAEAADPTVYVTGIEFDNENTVEFGQSLSVAAHVTPTNAGDQVYSLRLKAGSTLPTGTTFDAETGAVVAGHVEGSFTVEAVAHDSHNGEIKAEMLIHVKDPIVHVQEIVSSISSTTLYVGDTLNLGNGAGLVSVTPANATNGALEYESSNPAIITVDPDTGVVNANSVTQGQPVKITITSVQDPTVKKEISVTVKDTPVNRVVLAANSKSLYSGETFSLNPIVYFKSPNRETEDLETVTDVTQMTFNVTSGADVISVTPAGLVSALKNGSGTVEVYLTADPSVKATCAVTVTTRKPLVMSLNLSNDLQSYERKMDNLTPIAGLKDNGNASKSDFFEDDAENLLYKVGTVGEFKFAPVVKARIYNDAGVDIGTETYGNALLEYSYKMNGVALDEADIPTYFTKTTTGFQFTEDAIDNEFTVIASVKANDLYDLNGASVKNEFTFKVVKGYNAYTLEELSYIDNTTETTTGINWGAIRTAKGLPAFDSAKDGAIILHNDINITSSVLPENMLWTEDEVNEYIGTPSGRNDFQAWMQLLGIEDEDEAKEILYDSPDDYINIFSTHTAVGDDYRIEGNFFTIDTSSLSVTKRANPNRNVESLIDFQNGDGSHAQVFGFNADVQPPDQDDAHPFGDVTINNLKFVGNGGIQNTAAKVAVETDTAKKNRLLGDIRLAKGGYIGFKAGYVTFNVKNVINTGSFIGFMSEKHDYIRSNGVITNVHYGEDSHDIYTHMHIDRTKAYDSYNSMIYIWGTEDNTITNSWFTGAGGPLILMDEPDWSAGMQRSSCEVTNTYMQNPVTGAEPWFEQHHASSLVRSYLVDAGNPTLETGWLGKLAQVVAALNGNATTITKKDAGSTIINFLVIDMCAGNFAGNQKLLHGNFTIKDDENDTGFAMDMEKTAKDGSSFTPHLVPGAISKIIVETNLGGIEYINEANKPSFAAYATDQTTIAANADKFTGTGNYYKVGSADYVSYYLDIMKGTQNNNAGAFIGIFLGTYSYAQYWAA